ncbi:MAG: hypothetical protein WC670_13270 [Pseudolabrys sp.]|jgi:DNA-directed RNA polymerase subunit M/transcription elongation factor TFIIS
MRDDGEIVRQRILRGAPHLKQTEGTMTEKNLPPLCPVCGGNTTLKEMHRSSRGTKFTCFFRCVDCGTEYPRAIAADDVQLSALMNPPGAADGEADAAN